MAGNRRKNPNEFLARRVRSIFAGVRPLWHMKTRDDDLKQLLLTALIVVGVAAYAEWTPFPPSTELNTSSGHPNEPSLFDSDPQSPPNLLLRQSAEDDHSGNQAASISRHS